MPVSEEKLKALPSKAAQIRFLEESGMSRSDIAKKLGIRYQQVRNALVNRPLKGTVPVTIGSSPLLEKLVKIAEAEGASPQTLLDEALKDFIEKKRTGSPRPHVMQAYKESLKMFDALYQQLAK